MTGHGREKVRRVRPKPARGEGDRLARDGEDDRGEPDLFVEGGAGRVRAPAEDRVKAIAQIIGCDVDELLARAGRVASDLSDIIKRRPVELAALLRTTKD